MIRLLCTMIATTFTWATPGEVIVSDTLSSAGVPVSGPRSTQPTFLTGCIVWIPIDSVTAGVVDASGLAVLNRVRVISHTVVNVSVLFCSPGYAICKKTHDDFNQNTNVAGTDTSRYRRTLKLYSTVALVLPISTVVSGVV